MVDIQTEGMVWCMPHRQMMCVWGAAGRLYGSVLEGGQRGERVMAWVASYWPSILCPLPFIPYHTIPYHPYYAPCHSYHTIPFHTIPLPFIPYHTIPDPYTMPLAIHTIPYQIHTIPLPFIPASSIHALALTYGLL